MGCKLDRFVLALQPWTRILKQRKNDTRRSGVMASAIDKIYIKCVPYILNLNGNLNVYDRENKHSKVSTKKKYIFFFAHFLFIKVKVCCDYGNRLVTHV